MYSYKEEEGLEILDLLYSNPEVPIAVDTETTGLRITNNDYCIGISTAGVVEGKAIAHYFGIDHLVGTNINDETLDKLIYVLTQGRPLIFANCQFDILAINELAEINLEKSPFYDIQTMAHLINENEPISKSLDMLGKFYVQDTKIVDEYVEYQKKNGNKEIAPKQMFEYAAQDAVLTWRVWNEIINHPRWEEIPEGYWETKQDLIRVLLSMRRHGIRVDTWLAREYIAKGEANMKRLAAELGFPATPTKNDPDPLPKLGPKALTELFVERLELPAVKVSEKTGKPSFDKEAMEIYEKLLEEKDSPEAKIVLEYRGWQKAVSAAYRPYIELLDKDGRLRTSYKTFGTVTGRLSSSEPNLQQIPKSSDKEWNGKVKECFIAEEGYTLINADFSQLELRLGAAYAQEDSLKKVFLEGRDIFTEMSKQLGMSRQDTKTLVYSMQYGAGKKHIMSAFNVSKARARKIRSNYFETYPKFMALSERCASAVERSGKIKLWTGRFRTFKYRKDAYKAMNSMIQGGAADIMERCMVAVFNELESNDCRMLLQIHDSLLFEIKNELVEDYMVKIKELMEDVDTYVGHSDFDIRFAVEVEYWSDREKIKHDNIR